MPWLKTFKKPPKSSKYSLPLGTTSHFGAGLAIGAELDQGGRSEAGANNIGGSAKSAVRSPRGRKGQGTSAQPPTDMPPKCASDDDSDDCEADQFGKSEGRYRRGTTFEVDATSVDDAQDPTHGSRALKSILGSISAIYTDYEETAPVADKVEDLISRIIALEELFETPPVDVVEQGHRRELIRKLRTVEGRFRSLYGGPQPLQDNGDIPKLLEDLREAISDHCLAQQTELYGQQSKLISSDEAVALYSFPCSQGAEFLHDNRRGCLKGTCTAVLDEIELWTKNFGEPPVYWLNGPARTGKTAIAQEIAERTFADGQLGASFFCSREFEDRNNLRLILPTLAVQLARKYADFRSFFLPLVRSNPGIAHESLGSQMQKLIVQPLQKSYISTVVIIDALDECKDKEPTSAVLSVLARFVAEIPKVKFLVTGRPEASIREGPHLPFFTKDIFVLREVEQNQVDNEIRLFFRHAFSDIARPRRDLEGWPTEKQLDILCEQAAGSFLYAAAATKFMNEQGSHPRKQLDILLQSPESTIHKAKTNFDENKTLDSFYALILQGAFGDRHDPHSDPKIPSILGAMVLAANPLSPSTIATLLGFDAGGVFRLLSSARPLLNLQEDIDDPVLPSHNSFSNFIVDPNRCTNKRFYVSPSDHHPRLLVGCLNLMVRTLEGNMCKIPDGAANSDIDDLEQRVERYIDPALRYACGSWHTHLVDPRATSVDTSNITPIIHEFLESKFLLWLEVLSVIGAVRNAVDALQTVANWLEESPTLDLVNDCSRFVTKYFEMISASCRHIYHSALPLTPKSSIIWKLYEEHAQPFIRVVCGVPASWDSAVSATRCPFRIKLAAWSPCNRYIAVAPSSPVTVAILDSTTLQQLRNLEFSPKVPSLPHALIFSPDSRTVTCAGSGLCLDDGLFVVSWNVQTGRVVSAIKRRGPANFFTARPLITYSTDGRMIGILYRYRDSAIISIYDIASGGYVRDIRHGLRIDRRLPGELRFYGIWTHGGSLRFATANPKAITVWEVAGFTAWSPPKKVGNFPTPTNTQHTEVFNRGFPDPAAQAQFLQASHRLALIRLSGSVVQIPVWDPQFANPLLFDTVNRFQSPITISSDGRFLASSAVGPEVYLWKESSAGCLLAAKLPASSQYPSSLLSPNGESVIVYDNSMIRLWHTKGFTTTTSTSISTRPQQTGNFVIDFHPVKPLAAVARWEDNIVTILDLNSGLPQLTINTGAKVLGLRVIEDTVVVVGGGMVVAWKLPEGNGLPDARMGPQKTRAVRLNSKSLNNVIVASISPDLRHVALVTQGALKKRYLYIYNASTGQRVGYSMVEGNTAWFGPGRLNIWCAVGGKTETWRVNRNGLWKAIPVGAVDGGTCEFPWVSSRGYKVTKDGWIRGPGGKRLLMLPPPWRSDGVEHVWEGNYLALMHGSLSEPVILELGL